MVAQDRILSECIVAHAVPNRYHGMVQRLSTKVTPVDPTLVEKKIVSHGKTDIYRFYPQGCLKVS